MSVTIVKRYAGAYQLKKNVRTKFFIPYRTVLALLVFMAYLTATIILAMTFTLDFLALNFGLFIPAMLVAFAWEKDGKFGRHTIWDEVSEEYKSTFDIEGELLEATWNLLSDENIADYVPLLKEELKQETWDIIKLRKETNAVSDSEIKERIKKLEKLLEYGQQQYKQQVLQNKVKTSVIDSALEVLELGEANGKA